MRNSSFPWAADSAPLLVPRLLRATEQALGASESWVGLRAGIKAPGKQEGAAPHFPKNSTQNHLLVYCRRWASCFSDIFVSTGHFSFIFCVLKYISTDCYVTGKWHSYFSNDLIYRFINFRARRDYYDLQSHGQSHLPDDSLLQAQRFWPSENPSSQRETLSEAESTECWRIHITLQTPHSCVAEVLGRCPQLSPKLLCGQLPAHSPLTQSSAHTRKKSCFNHFLMNVWGSFRGRMCGAVSGQAGPGFGCGSDSAGVRIMHRLPLLTLPITCLVPTAQSLSHAGQTSQTLPESLSISFPFL